MSKPNKKLSLSQACRLCISIGIMALTVLVMLLLLKIPAIGNLFSSEMLQSQSGVLVWIIAWILIFLECSVIPGPYLPIVAFCATTALADSQIALIAVSTSAVIAGRIVAYFVGKYSSGPLLRWASGSEHDYDEWCRMLSGRAGMTTYAITVAAPFFPDFWLAQLAGAVKMNFWFYIGVNAVCKLIENILLIEFNFLLGGIGAAIPLYIVILAICIISYIVLSIIKYSKDRKGQH